MDWQRSCAPWYLHLYNKEICSGIVGTWWKRKATGWISCASFVGCPEGKMKGELFTQLLRRMRPPALFLFWLCVYLVSGVLTMWFRLPMGSHAGWQPTWGFSTVSSHVGCMDGVQRRKWANTFYRRMLLLKSVYSSWFFVETRAVCGKVESFGRSGEYQHLQNQIPALPNPGDICHGLQTMRPCSWKG